MWLTSWGYKRQLPADDERIEKLSKAAVEAMEAVNGRKYEFGPAGMTLYPAGGATDDFAKAVAGIPYAVTLELPGNPG